MLNIGIFCSASGDLAPIYYEEARRLGKWIGEHHHLIYYGGTHQGTDGNHGTKRTGIWRQRRRHHAQFMYDNGLASATADQIIVTHDMVERKNKMMELSDVLWPCQAVSALGMRFSCDCLRASGLSRQKIDSFQHQQLLRPSGGTSRRSLQPKIYAECLSLQIYSCQHYARLHKQLELADISKNSVPLDDE